MSISTSTRLLSSVEVTISHGTLSSPEGEPVWSSGKALGRDLSSNPLRVSFFFENCGLWTLFLWLCPSQLMKH